MAVGLIVDVLYVMRYGAVNCLIYGVINGVVFIDGGIVSYDVIRYVIVVDIVIVVDDVFGEVIYYVIDGAIDGRVDCVIDCVIVIGTVISVDCVILVFMTCVIV